MLIWQKRSIYFAIELSWVNSLRFISAVGTRNAICFECCFLFTLCPLKLIKCNKQCWNSRATGLSVERLLCATLVKQSQFIYFIYLYSCCFSCYSVPIHWLVHCHMTSNNEAVSRQMPWAGNIAKTVTSNGKQFTVTREMLIAVARHCQ